MNKEEFKNYIESIGFKSDTSAFYYVYKECEIYLHGDFYSFSNGSEWIRNIYLNDLTPLKKITRSIKLKQILK